MARAVYRLEHELAPSVFTDLVCDVIRDSIIGHSGIDGSDPFDRIAGPGMMTYTLDNTIQNRAGVASRYSPFHTNALAGFVRGTRVRLHADDGEGNARYIWSGYINTILPDPGFAGPRFTTVTAIDWMAFFAEFSATDLTLQQNKTSDELMNALVDAVPSQPATRDFDVGPDNYPVAFDDLQAGPKALQVAHDILSSGLEYLYLRGDNLTGEVLTQENRNARTLASVAASFTEDDLENVSGVLDVSPSDPEHIFNDIEVQTVPRRIDGVGVTSIIVKQDQAIPVNAGRTVEIFLDNQDPDNEAQSVGTLLGTIMALTTDWTANSAEDGSGSDVSGGFTVVASFLGSRTKITMTNSGAATGFVRGPGTDEGPQVRARAIRIYRPVGSKAVNQASIDIHGSQQLPSPLIMPYQDSLAFGQGAAEFIANVWGGAFVPKTMQLPSQLGGFHLAQGIIRDVGDKIKISESHTGLDEAVVIIHRRDFEVALDGRLFTTWSLAPADTSATMIWDDPVAGVWDANVWGFF